MSARTKAAQKPVATGHKSARLVKSTPATVDDTDAEDRQRGGGVQSLRRAVAILEAIAGCREGIGLADLSELVSLQTSTTFQLAKTLVSLGYIRQEKQTKRYRTGRSLFALAASAFDEIEMVRLAMPLLEDLSEDTGECSHFSAPMGDAVVVMARIGGTGTFQLTDRVGVVQPAHCTALGKAILASLQPEQLQRFLEHAPLKPSTERSITEIPGLLRELEKVRRTGIAYDDREFNSEVRCMAAPVKDFTGKLIGAIGISGPIWRLTDPVMRSQAQIVQAAAASLSAEFGTRWLNGSSDTRCSDRIRD